MAITPFLLYETLGEKLDDVDSEAAAQKLRGRVGTFVTIKLKNVLFGYLYILFVENPV